MTTLCRLSHFCNLQLKIFLSCVPPSAMNLFFLIIYFLEKKEKEKETFRLAPSDLAKIKENWNVNVLSEHYDFISYHWKLNFICRPNYGG